MSHSHIFIHQMSYKLPNGSMLFNELSLSFTRHKIGLVGRNGVGKSTLIKIVLGELCPLSGSINIDGTLAYVPQTSPTSGDTSVAALLGCEEKLNALQRIYNGSTNEDDFAVLNDDWEIDSRLQKHLAAFGLEYLPYHRPLSQLSGGEITRLQLIKAFIANADFLLLDEPTNHLDSDARQQLYSAIEQWKGGMIVISHDRSLLNLMEEIVELTALGAKCYGGNYDDYAAMKEIENTAIALQLHDAKRVLHQSKFSVQDSREKHEKKQAYGRELKRSDSIDKLSANSKRGRSEKTQSKLLIKKERMIEHAEAQLKTAREQIEISEIIDVDIPETSVPTGKVILDIKQLNFTYPDAASAIIHHFNMTLQGRERIALTGNNGRGKTTLIKLILGLLPAQAGSVVTGTERISYLDQNASLLKPELSILENFLALNPDANENDAYRYLAKFLFKNTAAQQLVRHLSGGEKLRALLACVLMSRKPPQLLILDEPTNHLDLHSIASIESALKNYQGAMIVISHDQRFLENIGITRMVAL